jgi:hypothetical protein
MNRTQVVKVVGFCLTFIFLCVVGREVRAGETMSLSGDTVELAIEYKTAYPGHLVKMIVLMKNPVAISGFNITFTLGANWNLINFHTDSIKTDTNWVPLDTCPDPDTVCTVDTCLYECDSTHAGLDSCPCLVPQLVSVRYCRIDTVRSLISKFSTVTAHGDTGDINSDSCKSMVVFAKAGTDTFIPPRANFDTLFKFVVDLSCLCDADTEREVYFLISPGFSFFSDNLGYTVPFKYDATNPGELFAWWSRPGDANTDSSVNSADIAFLINYSFVGGPRPCILEAADANGDCVYSPADISWLINYMFIGGPAPRAGCYCPKKEK